MKKFTQLEAQLIWVPGGLPIQVTSKWEAEALIQRQAGVYGALISMWDPHQKPLANAGQIVHRWAAPFYDTLDPFDDGPKKTHIERLIAFIRGLPELGFDYDARLLIHCEMGVSRSTAAALIAMRVLAHIDTTDIEIVQALKAAIPWADPNDLMLKYADELLGSQLNAAVDASDLSRRSRPSFPS